MTNASSLFRSLIVYSICLPVALLVGYLLATTTSDQTSLISMGVVLALMTIPMFLRWHYPWMLATWNMSAIVFFLPGRPGFILLLVMISFGISVLQYILNRRLNFISVPALTKPLLFTLAVVLLTARLTGGIGLNALGGSGDNVGGKGYIAIILGTVGYFALTAVKIPPQKRKLYVFLFFAGALTQMIANLALVFPAGLSFIFLVFPTDQAGINALSDSVMGPGGGGIVRLGGLSSTALALLWLLLAFYGIRGILDMRRPWRVFALMGLIVAILCGGYRSYVINAVLTIGVMFYLEGLTHTRILPMLVLCGVLGAAMVLPFTDKLPLNVQRSLTFIPGIQLDEVAVANASASSEWRLNMWKDVLPDVPKYLILGKGLSINLHDLDMERSHLNRGETQSAGSTLAGDYHNGPLSLIIPFGIFGVVGFVWFLVATSKILYRNYKHGDAELLLFNRFLLALFIMRVVTFFTVFGSFYADLFAFTGIIGLSVALNHGVAKPAPEPVARPVFHKFKLANANANADAAR
jgi:hypothetical protein